MYLRLEYGTMMRSFNLFLMFLLVLWAVPSSAQPDPGSEPPSEERTSASFSDLVEAAQKAYSEERYDEAIQKLVHAYSIRSNARLLFNIAKSYEKQGECAAALVYYRAYVDHPAKEKELITAAEKQMDASDECEAFSPDLAGRLSVDTTPEGATVVVDGESYGTTPTEVAPLSAGTHEISIELEGYEPISIDLELEPEKPREISQILQEETAEEEGDPRDDPAEAPPQSRESIFWPIHPAALAMGGVGLAGIGVAVVHDVVSIPATDRQRRQVARDSAEFERLTDRRNTQETIALIGYIGGGLLLTSGVVWHAIDIASGPSGNATLDREPQPTITVGVAPQSLQLNVRF